MRVRWGGRGREKDGNCEREVKAGMGRVENVLRERMFCMREGRFGWEWVGGFRFGRI